jgi:hypothetical protein
MCLVEKRQNANSAGVLGKLFGAKIFFESFRKEPALFGVLASQGL